eukprot:m51a1_g5172 hypothetical protein (533) ;mRNA; r:142415-144462
MSRLCVVALVLAVGVALCAGDSLDEFRGIFAAHFQRNNPGLTEGRLRQSLLYPTHELLSTLHLSDLAAIDAAFARVRPSDCKRVEAGLSIGGNAADPLAPLAARRAAGRAPVTIVSLSGMFNEFIPRNSIGAAYNASSTFALAFQRILKEHPRLRVPVWDNRVLADVDVPLGEIVTAGSVDAADGTPLYNVVYFAQREGSLESLRRPEIVVPRIVSRIGLFLDLVGSYVDDIVLVGFSRGTVDSLHIMSQADTLPWGSRIRGVITLDGVVYGTSLGDCGLGETTSNPPSLCEIISGMMSWVDLLNRGLVPKLTHVVQNTALITRVSAEVVLALGKLQTPEALRQSHLVFPDALKSWDQLIRDVLFDFDVLHPVINYDENIQRLKNLVGAILDSMRLLSTRTRNEWWANHTLPTDRLYASIVGSLADMDYTYPEVHPDEWGMRYMYYVTGQASGQELVDGPVQSARQMFHPEVHRALNPRQGPYEAHWLGLFHTTHEGAAMDFVFPCPDNWVDPFPRKTLVDSFATWIATHSN